MARSRTVIVIRIRDSVAHELCFGDQTIGISEKVGRQAGYVLDVGYLSLVNECVGHVIEADP